VPFAKAAEALLVLARTDEGVALFLVKTEDATLEQAFTIASDTQYEVTLDGAAGELVGPAGGGWAVWDDVMYDGIILLGAYAAGGARLAHEITPSTPRTASSSTSPSAPSRPSPTTWPTASARSTGPRCWPTRRPGPQRGPRREAVGADVEAVRRKTFRDITAVGQQVFGGVGFTLEYDIQLYFRRAKQLQLSWWTTATSRSSSPSTSSTERIDALRGRAAAMRRLVVLPLLVLVAAALVGVAPSSPAATTSRAVAVVATPSGAASWVAFTNGRVWPYGSDAAFFGDASGRSLKAPIVGMAATPSGQGYWLAAVGRRRLRLWRRPLPGERRRPPPEPPGGGDGGDTQRPGVLAGRVRRWGLLLRRRPVLRQHRRHPVGPADRGHGRHAVGKGYWFVASDGGVFSYGDARFAGSAAGKAGRRSSHGRLPDRRRLLAPGVGHVDLRLRRCSVLRSWSGGTAIASLGDSYLTIGPDGSRHGPDPSAACSIFPADNAWNADISTAPVNARSAAWVASIGASTNLHPDFGTIYGIPFVEVGAGQRRVPVSFDYADESDPGPYPIPAGAPVEGGVTATCSSSTATAAGCGSCSTPRRPTAARRGTRAPAPRGTCAATPCDRRVDLGRRRRPADLPRARPLRRGRRGHIDHALRFTIRRTQRAYVHPATHFASSITDPNAPPMGPASA